MSNQQTSHTDHVGGDKVLGDKVCGDKLINNTIIHSLDPNSMTDIIRNLMYKIATDDHESALLTIGDYQKLKLPLELENLFSILKIYINVFRANTQVDTDLVKSELNNESSPFVELYQAILIKLVAKDLLLEAKDVYSEFSNNANYYLVATYDQFFATREELQERLRNKLYTLDNYLLFYLAQGFWRLKDYDSSKKVFNSISTTGSNESIKYWIIASDFNSTIESDEVPYPYMRSDTARKMREIIRQFLDLISLKNNLSPLPTNILINLVNIFSAYIPEVMANGLRFRVDIAKIDVELGDWLNSIADKKPFKLSNSLISKLHGGTVLSKEELHNCVVALMQKSLNSRVTENWLLQSGEILNSDKFYKEFVRVFLLSFKNYSNPIEQNEYRISLNNFIEAYGTRLSSITPIYIMYLCDNLYNFDKFFEVPTYNILNKVCTNIAVTSELYPYYLKSLLRLNKLKTLSNEFDRIKDEEWNKNLYSIQARYLLDIGAYQPAVDTYEKFVDDSTSLYIWHNYLYCCYKIGKDFVFINQVLDRIPKSLFSKETEGFEFFITQIGTFIDHEFIDKILVELFIQQPNSYARFIVSLYLGQFSLNVNRDYSKSNNFDGVHQGIVYEVNGQRKQKIIVDNNLALHKEFISIDSPLGELLSTVPEGISSICDFENIILVQRQPTIITIFQLSMEIVNELQHTFKHKMFYQFEVSEESAVQDVLSIIQKFKSNDAHEEATEAFIRNSEISLYMKGRKLQGSTPSSEESKTVYSLLLNKYSNKCLNISNGNSQVNEAMVIDVYSFIYLCLTNIYKSVIASKTTIYLSQETYNSIQFWIDKITHKDYLTVNESDGKLDIVNSDIINKFHGNLIESLVDLLDYAIVESPKVFDLPIIVSEIKDLISESVISSIKLALSFDVPWLCLDSLICGVFATNKDFKIVNFHHFVHTHIEFPFLSFSDRKQGMGYWAYSGLYTEYFYTDLKVLTENVDDLPLLIKILDDTPLNFPSSDAAEAMIENLLEAISLKAYIYRNIVSKTLIIEQAIYSCLNKGLKVLEDKTAEERIAKMAFYLWRGYYYGSYIGYIIKIYERFIWGHFMNVNAINNAIVERKESIENSRNPEK